MKINFLGDSITYGEHLDRQDVWTSIIQNKRKDDIIINRGISGDTTAGMLSRFQVEVVADKPDVVHIMGGLNDMTCCATADQVKGNFKAMSKQAQFYGIQPIIGLCPLPVIEQIIPAWKTFADFDRLIEEMKNLHRWLHQYCAVASDIFLIDYNEKLAQYYQENRVDLYSDGLHLNTKGNEVLAKIFLDFYNQNLVK